MRRIGWAIGPISVTPPTLAREKATEPRRGGVATLVEGPLVPRRNAPGESYLFSFDCAMISWAVKLMPQVGKELPTKKLSDWSA